MQHETGESGRRELLLVVRDARSSSATRASPTANILIATLLDAFRLAMRAIPGTFTLNQAIIRPINRTQELPTGV